jgi:hypothetical protein
MKLLIAEVKKPLSNFHLAMKEPLTIRSDLSPMSFHVCEVMRIDRHEKRFFAPLSWL